MDGLQFGDNVVQAGFVLGQGRIRWTKRDGERFLLALEADGRELIMTVTEKNIKLKGEEDFSVSVRLERGMQGYYKNGQEIQYIIAMEASAIV